MIYDVTAISVDPRTGEVTGEPRVEEIDTETNEIFADATGPWEIEDRYHEFWNRLNYSWERNFPEYREKVLVISVVAQA